MAPRRSKPKPKAKAKAKAKADQPPRSQAKPQPKVKAKMPGLTVDTSSSHTTSQALPLNSQSQIDSHSRSTSPVRPPYSPITPTLEPAQLATSATGSSQNGFAPRATYSHSQHPQTAIPQPPPAPITLDNNPDAIALKSAISILQIQARNAAQDIRTLQQMKERAVGDPEGFARALVAGDVASKPDPIFNPSHESSSDEDDDEEESKMSDDIKGKDGSWGTLPTAQNIVRCPPINWAQYAVVGDSLDKLHKDQQSRPTEGTPQILQPDGTLAFGAEGHRRREDLGIAAPYQPGKDKIERMGTRKGGKR